jgi:hypothetical protein
MLKTFCGRPESDSKTLLLYIIAVSFPKMLYRMENHRTLAKRYYDCFVNLASKTFDFPEPPHISEKRSNANDKPFLSFLIFLDKITTTSNLQRVAADGATSRDIYNKETYMEFHKLLCSLLQIFHHSLTVVKEIQKETVKNGLLDLKQVMEKLDIVLGLGLSLKEMIASAAIEKHLKTIAHLLDVDVEKSWTVASEEDAELDTLMPFSMNDGQPLLPWQSYKEWLKLTVIHFDAAQILSTHFLKLDRGTEIDIKTLSPSLPSQKMLPWKDLLCHKVYFPKLPNNPEQPSAEDLITFLTYDFEVVMESNGNAAEEGNSRDETVSKDKGRQLEKGKGISIEEVMRSVKALIPNAQQGSAIAAKGVDMDIFTKELDSVIKRINDVDNCSSPGSTRYISLIHKRLEVLKHTEQTPEDRVIETREILEMLESLSGHSSLYQRLKDGTPLTVGTGFLGTRHCEVCIASFSSLSDQPDRYKEIRGEFAVSHTFILCSNVCQILQYRKFDKL